MTCIDCKSKNNNNNKNTTTKKKYATVSLPVPLLKQRRF